MLEQIVVVGLIGFGLAYTGAKLDGPFGVATWLKESILHAEAAPPWLQNGIECIYCWLFWTTLLAAVGVYNTPLRGEWVIGWLAGFGLGCMIALRLVNDG